MGIRLRNGYLVIRTAAVDDRGWVPREQRMIAVRHSAGGSYIYTRLRHAAELEFLTVPASARGRGRSKELLRHFVRHLDHRALLCGLKIAPLERGIMPQRLRKLYLAHGWQGPGPAMARAAKSTARRSH